MWLSIAFPSGFYHCKYCLGQLKLTWNSEWFCRKPLVQAESLRVKSQGVLGQISPNGFHSSSRIQKDNSIGAAPRGGRGEFILGTLQKTRLAPLECSHDRELVFKEGKNKNKQTKKHIHLWLGWVMPPTTVPRRPSSVEWEIKSNTLLGTSRHC